MKLGRANSQCGYSSLGQSALAIRILQRSNIGPPYCSPTTLYLFRTFVSRPVGDFQIYIAEAAEDESDSGCYCSDADLRSLLESLPSVSISHVQTRSSVDSLM